MSATGPGNPTPTSTDALLTARGVTKRFGGLVAVRDVDLDIPKGGIVSIIGPNGAGKTTFFNVVAGIIDPTAGKVSFRGRTLIARPHRTWIEPILWILPAAVLLLISMALGVQDRGEAALATAGIVVVGTLAATLLLAIIRPAWYVRLTDRFGVLHSARPNDVVAAGIGRTFQNIRLFQNMSALENVLVGMHLKLRSNLVDHMLATPRQRRDEEAAARRARQMTALIGRLRTELGLTILLIEHDMRVVMGISDHILVLDHGEQIAEGTPDEVRRDPKVIEAYLGTATT